MQISDSKYEARWLSYSRDIRVCLMVLFIFFPLFLLGCATASLQESIEDYSKISNEFRKDICSEESDFNQGAYVGAVRLGETQYDLYQFSDILAESPDTHNRLLEILLPEHSSEKALIRESASRQSEVSPAYLMCFVQSGSSLRMINNFDKYGKTNAAHTMIIEVLPSESAVYRALSPNQDTGEVMSTKFSADAQIDWHIRSRAKFMLMHGGYFLAIPADILIIALYAMQ